MPWTKPRRIVASTGVIDKRLSVKPFEDYMQKLVDGMTTDGHGRRQQHEIMTTDTIQKEVAVEFEITERCVISAAWREVNIHPNMATTLNFVTTDVAVKRWFRKYQRYSKVKPAYNCLSIDGDTSTK